MPKIHIVEGKIRWKGDKKAKWHEINAYKNKAYAEKIAKKYRRYYGKRNLRVRSISWPPKKKRRKKR